MNERQTDRRGFLKAAGYIGATSLAVLVGQQALATLTQKEVIPTISSSYVIWIDSNHGNVVKAKNGTTGSIDYSGIDSASVIQKAIDALGKDGGRILVRNGTYQIVKPIQLRGYIVLEGEGWGTVLKAAANFNNDIIQDSNPTGALRALIRNITLDGNSANQTSGRLMYLAKSKICEIDRVFFLDAKDKALHTYGSGPLPDNAFHNRIHHSSFSQCRRDFAIHMNDHVEETIFTDNIIDNCMMGGLLDDGVGNNQYTENQFVNVHGNSALSLRNGGQATIVAFNHFDSPKRTAIELDWQFASGNPPRWRIIGNTIQNAGCENPNTYDAIDCDITPSITSDVLIKDNVFWSPQNYPRYCINLHSSNGVTCLDNNFANYGTAPVRLAHSEGPFKDTFSLVSAPFTQGTQYVDPYGFQIDHPSDYATTYLTLPAGALQVVAIRIWAQSLASTISQMGLRIKMSAAADKEPYDKKSEQNDSKPSISQDFSANDIIYWSFISKLTDAFRGGDNIAIRIEYLGPSGSNIATSARFRNIEVHYV